MSVRFFTSAVIALAFLPVAAFAQHKGNAHDNTPYAGFETRAIKSLSETDLEELRRGGGWGLALPAELNGRPGPAHLLEHRDALGLSDDQVAAITAIYEEMRTDAVAAGQRFIAAEAALSDALAGPGLSKETLQDLVAEAAKARAALRYVHLSRHLSTPELLSDAQVQTYNVLRGYADDPCASTPEGHDPAMWRRHNGCDG